MKGITSPELAWLQITDNILHSFSDVFLGCLQIFYTANTLFVIYSYLHNLQVDSKIREEVMTAAFSL